MVSGRHFSAGSPRLRRCPVCSRNEPVRRSSRRRSIPRVQRAGGWFSRRALILPGDSVDAITAKSKRDHRATNSPCAGRLVLGAQPLENSEAQFSPDALQARRLRSPKCRRRDLKPFRILIRGTNWLGDSVISMPAVRAIKAGRPDAHVTIAAPEKIAAVWKLVPEVDEVIPPNERITLQRSAD